MSKDQRLTFIITEDERGNVHVRLDFYPKLVQSEGEFRKLPLRRQKFHNMALALAKAAAEGMAKNGAKPQYDDAIPLEANSQREQSPRG